MKMNILRNILDIKLNLRNLKFSNSIVYTYSFSKINYVMIISFEMEFQNIWEKSDWMHCNIM